MVSMCLEMEWSLNTSLYNQTEKEAFAIIVAYSLSHDWLFVIPRTVACCWVTREAQKGAYWCPKWETSLLMYTKNAGFCTFFFSGNTKTYYIG